MIYRLASSTLLKFGSTDIAWMAADRGIAIARASGEITCLARASRGVARAMTSSGQPREAIDLLATMANRLEPVLRQPGTSIISLYGMMLLAAEIAAAKNGDAKTASDFHHQAEATARRLDPDHVDQATAFGSWNVKLHRVAALVRLQEGADALNYARQVTPVMLSTLPIERRVNFWLDVAHANEQCGRPVDATARLLEAERVSPQEVRCRPVVHALIRRLAQGSSGQRSTDLRALAARAGVAE